MQTSKNLMEEVSKIIRVIKPDMKIFVGDSLAGNDTVNQAREFFEYTNYDGSILTKSDADSKGGAAISIAYLTHKPILYLGVGQGYDDLAEFDYDAFLDSIFKDRSYEKSGENLKELKDDIFEQETFNDVPKTESQTDKSTLETLIPDTKKSVESDKLLASSTIAATTNPIENDKEFGRSEFTNVGKEEPNTSNKKDKIEDQLVKQKNEIKAKKGSFLRFFKEKDDKQQEDQDNINKVKQNEDEDIKRKKDKETSKKVTESKSEDEVVYLTDDDIDDLIK
jgi:fused signal recognition particle receptor